MTTDKKPLWGSKGAVNRAGTALREKTLTPAQTQTLEFWRIDHRGVIHSFEALLRARAKGKSVEVAQRLKRRHTIFDKLHRFPKMNLARMDDVAGCRLIFPSISDLHEFRNNMRSAKFSHILKNTEEKYDYITNPTDRGYRGIHDVYEFRARGNRGDKRNGLLIEIQYRTQLQHAWSTAVEVVTQLTENEPKFDRGDPRHIRFFCLASEMLARVHEQKKSCLPNLSERDLLEELEKLEEEIGVMRMLVSLHMHKFADDHAPSQNVILHIPQKGDLKFYPFDIELDASNELLKLEREHPDDDIVLVGAKSVAEVTSAFRNYFKDVTAFIEVMVASQIELAAKPFDFNEADRSVFK